MGLHKRSSVAIFFPTTANELFDYVKYTSGMCLEKMLLPDLPAVRLLLLLDLVSYTYTIDRYRIYISLSIINIVLNMHIYIYIKSSSIS